MKHLTIRTTSKDEGNLSVLREAWGCGRSEVGRRALDIAVALVKQEQSKTKLELLKESGLIGSLDTGGSLRSHYKKTVQNAVRKKYASKKCHR